MMSQPKPRQHLPGPPLVRSAARGIDWTAVGIALAAAGIFAAVLWLCAAGGVAP